MSQESATTNTSPVMVCFSSSVSTPVTMAPMGPSSSFGIAACGSAATADAMGHKSVVGLTTVSQQLPQS